MTSLERLKKLSELEDKEEEATTGTLEIEAPKQENSIPKTDKRTLLLTQLEETGKDSLYSKGKESASKQGSFLDSTSDRATLTKYYQAYTDEINRAIQNQDEQRYYQYRILADRTAKKLGIEATPTAFAQDWLSEVGGNIRGSVADTLINAEKIKQNLTPVLDADVLYNVAKSPAGGLGNTIDNYGWGKDNVGRLQALVEKYPTDNVVVNLYNTVTKQGYTGDKQYFEDTVKYVNQLERTNNFNNSFIAKQTKDEKQFLEDLKAREALSWDSVGQGILNATGVVSYMLPSVGLGYGLGETAIANGLGQATAGSIAQAGSLASMYMSAAGNAFNETLKEGYDWDKASLYSQLMGGLEVATEMIGGENVNSFLFGWSKKTALGKVTQSLINRGGNKIAKFLISMAADVGAEAAEEIISALVEPHIKKLVLGEDTNLEDYWKGVLDAGLSSILPTLIMAGFGKARIVSNVNKTQKALLEQLDDYEKDNTPIFTKSEMTEMRNAINRWSEDAKVGIMEHYDEIKQKTYSYEEVMDDIYRQLGGKGELGQRALQTLAIANFAGTISGVNMSNEQKEQQIIQYAKSVGIDEKTLRELFGNKQIVFPNTFSTTQEAKPAQQPSQPVQPQQPAQPQKPNQPSQPAQPQQPQQPQQPTSVSTGLKSPEGTELKEYKKGGHTKQNYTDGKYVYKSPSVNGNWTEESKIYESLNGKDYIAEGELVDVTDENGDTYQMIRTPLFKHVISVDDIPQDKRADVAKTDFLNVANVYKLYKAMNELTDGKVLYNDPLQVGFNEHDDPQVFDFSNSNLEKGSKKWADFLRENYYALGRFLNEFGAKEMSAQLDGAIRLLDRLSILDSSNKQFLTLGLDQYEKAIFDEFADDIIKYNLNPSSVYTVYNAREIPKREGDNEVLRSHSRITEYGPYLVFSQEPLSEKFIYDWELKPIYENRFGERENVANQKATQPATSAKSQGNTQQPQQPQQPAKKPTQSRKINTFQDLEKKYGQAQADPRSQVSYIEVPKDKAGKFEFSNFEYGPNGLGDETTSTQEELSKNPVALVKRGKSVGKYDKKNPPKDYGNKATTVKIFREMDDLKAYLNAYGIDLMLTSDPQYYGAKSVAGIGGYYVSEEAKLGNYVWRSEFNGKKVEYQNPPKSPIGDSANAFKKKIQKPSYDNIVGKTYKALADLADLFTPYLDPTGETTRVVIVKTLNNGDKKIVGLEEARKNNPGSTGTSNRVDLFFDYISQRLDDLGGDDIVFVHNHPANSEPSPQDLFSNHTQNLRLLVRNRDAAADLVVGLDDYSTIELGSIIKNKPYKNGYSGKKEFFKDSFPWNEKMLIPSDVAKVAEVLPTKPGMSKIIVCDFRDFPRAVVDISNSFLKKATRNEFFVEAFDLALEYGGATVDIVTDDDSVFNISKKFPTEHLIKTDSAGKLIDYKFTHNPTVVGYGYDNSRPPTYSLTPEQYSNDDPKYWGRDVLADSEEVVEEQKYIPKTKRRFLKDFEHVGYINVNGSKIHDIYDLADVSQIFRDPTVETFRLLFVKNDICVGQSAYTALATAEVSLKENEAENEIRAKMRELGADKYYMLHNHPTANITPSKPDIQVTKTVASKTSGFGGHIIIDHNAFSFIDANGDYTENIPLRKSTTNEIEKYISQDGWFKTKYQSPESIAAAAAELRNNKDYSAVFFFSQKNTIQLMQELPNTFFDKTGEELLDYFQKLARQNGASKMAITTQSTETYEKILGKNIPMLDLIQYSASENGDLEAYHSALKSNDILQSDFYTERAKKIPEPVEEKREPLHRLAKKTTNKSKTEPTKKVRKSLRKDEKPTVNKTDFEVARTQSIIDEVIEKPLKDVKPTDLEKKRNSEIVRYIEAINDGTIQRDEGREKTSIEEIVGIIKKIMNGKVGKLKGPITKSAYGIFNPVSHWIRARQMSNISTWFHEWGHEINSDILNMEALEKAFKDIAGLKDELVKLCQEAFGKRYDKKKTVRLQEGFAEAVRRFVENPENFAKQFPAVSELFAKEATNDPDFAEMLENMKLLSEKVKDFENMTAKERYLSRVHKIPKENTGHTDSDSAVVKFGMDLGRSLMNDIIDFNRFDRAAALGIGEKYSSMKEFQKSETAMRLAGNAQNIIEQLARGLWVDGVKLTKGLNDILHEYLPTEEEAKEKGVKYEDYVQERMDDLIVYGLAMREKYLDLNRDEKIMVGSFETDRDAIIKQYANDKKLQNAIEDIQENSHAIITYAVNSGIIDAKTGQNIISHNLLYFPMNRAIEGKTTNFGSKGKGGSTGDAFRKLRGSDAPYENPILSLAGNWGRILQTIEYNNAIKTMVDLGRRFTKHGDWFEIDVNPPYEYRGKAEMLRFKDAFLSEIAALETNHNLKIYDADKNQVLPTDAAIDALDKLMDWSSVYNLFAPLPADEKNLITSYLVNGKRVYLQFADNDMGKPLFEALTKLTTRQTNVLLDLFGSMNTILKLGATAWNWEFALGNMQSDAVLRFLYSDGFVPYIPVFTTAVNIANLAKGRGSSLFKSVSTEEDRAMYEKYQRSGASQAGRWRATLDYISDHSKELFGYDAKTLFGKEKPESFVDVLKALKKKVGRIPYSKIGKILQFLPEFSEEATRYAEFCLVYNKMKAEGKWTEEQCIREAGIKARNITQDFTVQGSAMRELNKLVPFASAQVGGFYRFGQELRNNPRRLGFRMSLLAVVTAMITLALRGDDRDYYDEVNTQKKFDNFFFVNPFDKQHPFIIKKPQGVPRYFVNLIQLLTEGSAGYVTAEEMPNKINDWFLRSVSDQLPVTKVEDLTPGVLQAFLENRFNQSLFYGTPIVSQDLEKLDPRHQYDENTSAVARAIGNVFNLSPLKVDNILKTSGAGLGKRTLGLIDVLLLATEGRNLLAEKDISEQMFLSKVFGNVFRSSETINDLYDRIEELETEEAEGRLTDEQRREYENLKVGKSTLAQYNKKIREVQDNTSLSPSEKKEQLNTLRGKRIDAARYYMGKKLLNENNKAEIEKTSFYPSNDTYSYTISGKKYTLDFSSQSVKDEYAKMFIEDYNNELKKLKDTIAYKKATEQEKLEMEKTTKEGSRRETTNKMKKIVYKKQYAK